MVDISHKISYDIEMVSPNVTYDKLNTYIFHYPCELNTLCYPYDIIIQPGRYLFQLWGAQGGDSRYQNIYEIRKDSGGKGAFVSGVITIKQTTRMFLHVGGKGEDQIDLNMSNPGNGGYNGGGNGGKDTKDDHGGESSAGGGGASDIRLLPNSINEIESLKSRIIVAAGGGGACSTNHTDCEEDFNLINNWQCTKMSSTLYSDNNEFIGIYIGTFKGGPGGGLHGYTYNNATFPGEQTKGNFGHGSDGINISQVYGGSIGGAGGGYYGGTSISIDTIDDIYYEVGGSGGSSYVSGYDGCNSVSAFPLNEINHTNQSLHYSGLYFQDIKMISGMESMSDPFGIAETGHSGNGAISITFLKELSITCFNSKSIITHSYSILFYTFIRIK